MGGRVYGKMGGLFAGFLEYGFYCVYGCLGILVVEVLGVYPWLVIDDLAFPL